MVSAADKRKRREKRVRAVQGITAVIVAGVLAVDFCMAWAAQMASHEIEEQPAQAAEIPVEDIEVLNVPVETGKPAEVEQVEETSADIWAGYDFSVYTPEETEIREYMAYICEVCTEYHINPDFIVAMIERESRWEADAYNGGCVGLMQIAPVWHSERMERLGITDLYDGRQNILCGVDFIAELLEKYGEPYAALMYYNGGYSEKAGIVAYQNGILTGYAVEIVARTQVLEEYHGIDTVWIYKNW